MHYNMSHIAYDGVYDISAGCYLFLRTTDKAINKLY